MIEENEKAYLVMEYHDGHTLTEEIRKNGKWSMEKTVRTFIPVMQTLERMHKSDVIHQDINPDNLIVKQDGTLAFIGFGTIKYDNNSAFTKSAILKHVYSPPEQRDAGTDMKSTVDIYALAATMYYAITGAEPEDVLSRLLFDELKKPSEIGADILPAAEKALLSCMELRPEDRTESVREIREAFEAAYPDNREDEKEMVAY